MFLNKDVEVNRFWCCHVQPCLSSLAWFQKFWLTGTDSFNLIFLTSFFYLCKQPFLFKIYVTLPLLLAHWPHPYWKVLIFSTFLSVIFFTWKRAHSTFFCFLTKWNLPWNLLRNGECGLWRNWSFEGCQLNYRSLHP